MEALIQGHPDLRRLVKRFRYANGEQAVEFKSGAFIIYRTRTGSGLRGWDEIDLLVVDEFQDTSPIQLALFSRLAECAKRVVWVGDVKQSIYGFQGADAAGFARERQHYRAAVPQAGLEFRAVPLDVSFRSTAPVLALVDAVFEAGAARQGVARHGPNWHGRRGMACHGVARPRVAGLAGHGLAWRGAEWQARTGKASRGEARSGEAWQARPGMAGQGRARQGRNGKQIAGRQLLPAHN
jgi:hypothetical protein